MPSLSKKIVLAYWLLGFAGFLDGAYLTLKYYTAGIIPCVIGNCEQVTSSIYSTVGPVPVALLGALYYLFILLCAAASTANGNPKPLYFAAKISVIGFAASLWFVFAQAFLIKAWCQYCLLSALISTLIFLLSYLVVLKKKP